jgi:DME family drug/metabolite transporter
VHPSEPTDLRSAGARQGLVLVCVAGVIWGTIGPGVDVVHDRSSLSVWMIGAYRAMAAVVALLLAVALTGRAGACRRLMADHPVRLVAVGVLTASFMLLFFVSVVFVGVSIATVVGLGWAPVFLQLVHAVRERRPPPPGEVLTVCAALAGLLLISVAGGGQTDAPHPVLGVVAVLAAGTAYAVSAELLGPLKQHDPLGVATVTMSVAAVVLVVSGLAVTVTRSDPLSTGDGATWLLLGYLGVGTMALAYVLLFAGLRTTPSRTAVVATLLEPVTAVVIAVLLLGEHLTLAGAAGAVLILVAIGSLGLRRPEPAPQ